MNSSFGPETWLSMIDSFLDCELRNECAGHALALSDSINGSHESDESVPRNVKKGRADVVFDLLNTPNDLGKVMNEVKKAKIQLWELIHCLPEVIREPPETMNDPPEAVKCWCHAFLKLAPCLRKLAPCLLKLASCLLRLTPCFLKAGAMPFKADAIPFKADSTPS